MWWGSLQMVSLGSMLIFRAVSEGCSTQQELQRRIDKFRSLHPAVVTPTPNTPTCEKAAIELRGEQNGRSLSPWTYGLERDADRYPPEIARAHCLCEGCIVNGHHDHNFNSVPVYAPLLVLKKVKCSDPNKYKLKKKHIKVPVGCTCLAPKQQNNQ